MVRVSPSWSQAGLVSIDSSNVRQVLCRVANGKFIMSKGGSLGLLECCFTVIRAGVTECQGRVDKGQEAGLANLDTPDSNSNKTDN